MDKLLPSVSKLVLNHKQSSNTRSDILDNDFDDDPLDISGEEEDFDFEEEDQQNCPNVLHNNYNADFDNSDYG